MGILGDFLQGKEHLPKFFFKGMSSTLLALDQKGKVQKLKKQYILDQIGWWTYLLCPACDNRLGIYEGLFKEALYGRTQSPLKLQKNLPHFGFPGQSMINSWKEVNVDYKAIRWAQLGIFAKMVSAAHLSPGGYAGLKAFGSAEAIWKYKK